MTGGPISQCRRCLGIHLDPSAPLQAVGPTTYLTVSRIYMIAGSTVLGLLGLVRLVTARVRVGLLLTAFAFILLLLERYLNRRALALAAAQRLGAKL